MPNYQNGKIYKIWSINSDKIYIGSTCLELPQRLADHRKGWRNGSVCKSIYFFGDDDVRIDLIEYCPCNNKMELDRREGQIQLENKDNIVNNNIAGRTVKEWYQANQDKILVQKKEYYQNNKDKTLANAKEYYQNNKDKLKDKVKEYKTVNKDKINARRREQYALKKQPKS